MRSANNTLDTVGDFDLLTPEIVINAVEEAFDLRLSGTLIPYNSYINRVYEVQDEEGGPFMVKFYRPGRWSEEAILEEHEFIRDCVEMEIPTVAPLLDTEGHSLPSLELAKGESEDKGTDGRGINPADIDEVGPAGKAASTGELAVEYHFALFPKRGGRNFDAETEEDWIRLGALVGRMHNAAKKTAGTPEADFASPSNNRDAAYRRYCLPTPVIEDCIHELKETGLVHPDQREEFFELAEYIRLRSAPLFEGIAMQRLHGDCHRGNILERPAEGLLLIDFDDMMIGPAIQDLWLLLPGRLEESREEFNLIVEGYERFLAFDYRQVQLIEPLRAMRMLYYLSWSAKQRNDHRFRTEHPQWGSAAFWSKEIEDLREQINYL